MDYTHLECAQKLEEMADRVKAVFAYLGVLGKDTGLETALRRGARAIRAIETYNVHEIPVSWYLEE